MLISSRANTILLVLILAVGIGVVAMLATRSAAGPLDPPGPPSTTGTLPQVEPRSPIPPVGWNGTFPIVISQPGSYFLTRNINGIALKDGISITTGNVSLDLNGFTLAGTGAASSGADGINVTDGQRQISISNGYIQSWDTGIFSGPASALFDVEHVTALSNGIGIRLPQVSEITGCTVNNNSYYGIVATQTIVRACSVSFNASIGMAVDDRSLVEGSKVWNNANGIYVQGSNNTLKDNDLVGNTTDVNIGISVATLLVHNTFTAPVTGGVCGIAVSGGTYLNDFAEYHRSVC